MMKTFPPKDALKDAYGNPLPAACVNRLREKHKQHWGKSGGETNHFQEPSSSEEERADDTDGDSYALAVQSDDEDAEQGGLVLPPGDTEQGGSTAGQEDDEVQEIQPLQSQLQLGTNMEIP